MRYMGILHGAIVFYFIVTRIYLQGPIIYCFRRPELLINVRGVVKMCQNDNIHSKRTLVSECN